MRAYVIAFCIIFASRGECASMEHMVPGLQSAQEQGVNESKWRYFSPEVAEFSGLVRVRPGDAGKMVRFENWKLKGTFRLSLYPIGKTGKESVVFVAEKNGVTLIKSTMQMNGRDDESDVFIIKDESGKYFGLVNDGGAMFRPLNSDEQKMVVALFSEGE